MFQISSLLVFFALYPINNELNITLPHICRRDLEWLFTTLRVSKIVLYNFVT